jgi:hypothetical protein
MHFSFDPTTDCGLGMTPPSLAHATVV